MAIAVIADTHDKLPGRVLKKLGEAEAIWHLGDVCKPETLDPILQLGLPFVIVRGNNDAVPEWPLTVDTLVGEQRCRLIHIPPKRMPTGVDVLFHGHTHVPRDEMVDGVRVLNPGCITRPKKKAPRSFAWLSVTSAGLLSWQLEVIEKS